MTRKNSLSFVSTSTPASVNFNPSATQTTHPTLLRKALLMSDFSLDAVALSLLENKPLMPNELAQIKKSSSIQKLQYLFCLSCTDVFSHSENYFDLQQTLFSFYGDGGLTPKTKDDRGRNALHYAAWSGNTWAMICAKRIVRAPVGEVDNHGCNELHYAALSGDTNAIRYVKRLFEASAIELSATDRDGKDALYYAWRSGNLDAVVYVSSLLNKTPTDVEINDKTNALHHAALSGLPEAMQVGFRVFGVSPWVNDKDGANVLHYAAFSGEPEAMKYASAPFPFGLGMDSKSVDTSQRNALHYACLSGFPAAIRYAAETFQLDPNGLDADGMSPLHYAAWSGSRDAMTCATEFLKITPEVVDHDGMNALHYAVWSGSVDSVDYALAPIPKGLGLNLFSVDHEGRGVLHYASLSRHKKIISAYLINKLTEVESLKSLLTLFSDPITAKWLSTSAHFHDALQEKMRSFSLEEFVFYLEQDHFKWLTVFKSTPEFKTFFVELLSQWLSKERLFMLCMPNQSVAEQKERLTHRAMSALLYVFFRSKAYEINIIKIIYDALNLLKGKRQKSRVENALNQMTNPVFIAFLRQKIVTSSQNRLHLKTAPSLG